MTITQQFLTMTITVTIKIPLPPVPPNPTGAKKSEPVFMEGQRPICRYKVHYGKEAA